MRHTHTLARTRTLSSLWRPSRRCHFPPRRYAHLPARFSACRCAETHGYLLGVTKFPEAGRCSWHLLLENEEKLRPHYIFSARCLLCHDRPALLSASVRFCLLDDQSGINILSRGQPSNHFHFLYFFCIRDYYHVLVLQYNIFWLQWPDNQAKQKSKKKKNSEHWVRFTKSFQKFLSGRK